MDGHETPRQAYRVTCVRVCVRACVCVFSDVRLQRVACLSVCLSVCLSRTRRALKRPITLCHGVLLFPNDHQTRAQIKCRSLSSIRIFLRDCRHEISIPVWLFWYTYLPIFFPSFFRLRNTTILIILYQKQFIPRRKKPYTDDMLVLINCDSGGLFSRVFIYTVIYDDVSLLRIYRSIARFLNNYGFIIFIDERRNSLHYTTVFRRRCLACWPIMLLNYYHDRIHRPILNMFFILFFFFF